MILIMVIIIIFSYLLGSLNTSIIITKNIQKSDDIRTQGSGNAGFTNVIRIKGKKLGIITFLGDFSKGIMAVCLSKILLEYYCVDKNLITLGIYISAFSCILGHVFPCFFNFRGGKGVLTAAASTLILNWRFTLVLAVVFLIVLAITKMVSLASISAAALFPILVAFFEHKFSLILISFFAALLIVLRHKSNIEKIIKGKENKIF